jgi:hypothetical protein
MEKDVEQDQARGGGLRLPIWTDVQGWQEETCVISEIPGISSPLWLQKILLRHARSARSPVRDLRAPGLYTRELVPGGGSVCRRHRRLSPDTRARAEASSCRWPARHSGTVAAYGECNAAS